MPYHRHRNSVAGDVIRLVGILRQRVVLWQAHESGGFARGEEARFYFVGVDQNDGLTAGSAARSAQTAGDIVEPDLGALAPEAVGVYACALVERTDDWPLHCSCLPDLRQIDRRHHIEKRLRLLRRVPVDSRRFVFDDIGETNGSLGWRREVPPYPCFAVIFGKSRVRCTERRGVKRFEWRLRYQVAIDPDVVANTDDEKPGA